MLRGKTQNRKVYIKKRLINYSKIRIRGSSKKEQYQKIEPGIERSIIKPTLGLKRPQPWKERLIS